MERKEAMALALLGGEEGVARTQSSPHGREGGMVQPHLAPGEEGGILVLIQKRGLWPGPTEESPALTSHTGLVVLDFGRGEGAPTPSVPIFLTCSSCGPDVMASWATFGPHAGGLLPLH